MKNTSFLFFSPGFFLLLIQLMGCQSAPQRPDANSASADYLLLTEDTSGAYGYRNQLGELLIPFGKYAMCLTDTFRTYALVLGEQGFVVIDRQEQVQYQVFNYDNGPDYPSEGLFRIVQNGKIGYADAGTYAVVIQPQFDCAFPFENGVARVSNNCKTEQTGEYSTWVSDAWKEIDKQGNATK